MKSLVFSMIENGLSTTRIRILRALGEAGGTMSLSDLTHSTGIDRSTVRSQLRRFEAAGVVKVEKHPSANGNSARLLKRPLTTLAGPEGAVYDQVWSDCLATDLRQGVPMRRLAEAVGLPTKKLSTILRILERGGWIEVTQDGPHTVLVAPSSFAIVNYYLALHRGLEIVHAPPQGIDAKLELGEYELTLEDA